MTYSLVVAQRRAVGRCGACRSSTRCRPGSRSCPRPAPGGRAPTRATSRSPAPGPTYAAGDVADDHRRRDRPGPGRDPDQHGVGRLAPPATPTPPTTPRPSTTDVGASADLSIVKSGPATVTASGAVTYSPSRGERRPVRRRDGVGDRHPARRASPSSRRRAPGWSCTNSRQRVGHLHPGHATPPAPRHRRSPSSVTAPAQPASLTNTATVSAATPDPAPATTPHRWSTTVTGSADLSVVKAGPATVVGRRPISYSLVVANAGPRTPRPSASPTPFLRG